MLTFYKKKRFNFRKLVLVANMCVMLGCCVYLYQYYQESADTGEKVEKLKELIIEVEEEEPEQEQQVVVDKPQVDEETGELILLNKFKKALKAYPDLVGWITIDDLLDYPVMQTSMDDPLYYLYRNIDGEYSKPGTPYMDARCDITKPSSNFIVYAHNMKNLTMFGWLAHYANEKFYEEHPVIKFDTLYFTGTYEIFAAFYGEYYGDNPDYEDAFKYYEFIDTDSKKEFNEYIKNIKECALYETDVEVEYGDQILTLSTCNHTGGKENGRFVVVARLKRSDANADKGNKMDLDDDELHKVTPTVKPSDDPDEEASEDEDEENEEDSEDEDEEEEDKSKKPDKDKDKDKNTKKPEKTEKPKATKDTSQEATQKATKKDEAAEEPTKEVTPKPTPKPTPEPTPKPTKKPTKEPTVEPTKEPSEATNDPTTDPEDDPVDDPVVEPTQENTDDNSNTGEDNQQNSQE